MANKIKKTELTEIIMETIYEMLKSGDEGLINLMRETEMMNGDVEENINEWTEKTLSILEESLNIDPDIETINEDNMSIEHIEMLRLSGALNEGADKHAARELELYIDNDGQLYSQRIEPVLKNLSKKHAKGKYDHKLAVKLWMYTVDEGAKKYHKEFGMSGKWNDTFSKATRLVVAGELEKNHREEIENGDYL